MKKTLAIGALVLLLLAAPGAVGIYVASQQQTLIEDAARNGADLRMVAYERGWFTSSMQHSLWTPGNRAAGGDPAERAEITIDSSVAHGLLPLWGSPRSLAPALARIRSTATMRIGEDVVAIPGEALTTVGLFGSGNVHYLADPMEVALDGNGTLDWDGADFRVDFTRAGEQIHAYGDVGQVRASSNEGSFVFGPMTFENEAERHASDLWPGTGDIHVETLDVVSDAASLVLRDIAFRTELGLADDQASLGFTIEASEVSGAAWEGKDAGLALNVSGLDAAAFASLVQAVSAIQAQGQSLAPPQTDVLAVDRALDMLVRGGGTLSIDRLHVPTPEGAIDATLALRLAPGASAIILPSLLGALDGELSLRIPRQVAQKAAAMDPGANDALQSGLAFGLLRSEGNDYVLDATYRDGQLTVNGLRLPALPGS